MIRTSVMSEFPRNRPMLHSYRNYTVWKVSVFGVFLLRILPRSEWVRDRTTPNGHFSCSVSQLVTSYHFKSSHRGCPIKMVFWNFFKNRRKVPVTGSLLRSANLLKKGLWYRCFPVSFSKFWLTLFLKETPLVTASSNYSLKFNAFHYFCCTSYFWLLSVLFLILNKETRSSKPTRVQIHVINIYLISKLYLKTLLGR